MIRKLLPILGITFIDIMGFSILIPILPYFVKHFGASDFTVGILFSTFAFCGLIAGPIWGNVSDRIGRKGVLIISQIGATIGWAILAFAPTMVIVFIARIIEGLSGGNIGVTQAYVTDLVEPKERTRAYSYVAAAFGAGFPFGGLIGGFLLDRFGFSAPFLVAAGLQLVTLIVTIAMLPESTKRETREKVASFSEIVANLKNKRTAPVLWQKLAISLGLYAWFAVFALYLQAALGMTASQAAYMFAGFGVLNALLQALLVGRVSDALGDRWTSNLGLATLVCSFMMIPFVHTFWTVAAAFTLFGIGMSLTNPTITSLISQAAPPNQRGTILSVASSLDSLSGVVTPMASTAVLGRFGSPFAGLVSLCFELIALVLGLFSTKREQMQEKSDAAPASLSEEKLVQA
ncbi:MAG: MFS transporter [Candidatus Eremiobacteraeota bacterium]|nr:MFS transporter [Candidatus Eremiobacteraeota bacterium]